MKQTKAFLVILLFAGLATACKRAPEAALTGRWQEINGSDVIEFRPDGSFGANMKYGMGGQPRDLSGKYFVAGDSVSIDLGDNSPMTWKFQQTDDRLVVTYAAGGAVKMDGAMAQFSHAE